MNRRRVIVEFGKDDLETLLRWSTSSLASVRCAVRANMVLMAATGFDHCRVHAGEILAENVAKVIHSVVLVIGEELAFGLEVAQLKYQVNGADTVRIAATAVRSGPLSWKKRSRSALAKTQESVQIIDFTGGENGQAMMAGVHAM